MPFGLEKDTQTMEIHNLKTPSTSPQRTRLRVPKKAQHRKQTQETGRRYQRFKRNHNKHSEHNIHTRIDGGSSLEPSTILRADATLHNHNKGSNTLSLAKVEDCTRTINKGGGRDLLGAFNDQLTSTAD
jgi:hypothetical protein